MSSMQICIHNPPGTPKTLFPSFSSSNYLSSRQLCAAPTLAFQPLPFVGARLKYASKNYRQPTFLCSSGGKGKQGNDSESSPWKALEKAMSGFRNERSIQDVLREQMRNKEFGDDGGSGSGIGGGGGDGSGDSEDEGFWDELLQVVLATLGFIFVYLYIIMGEEIMRLAKDYITYLFRGRKSVRLDRAMFIWKRFFKTTTRKKVVRQDSLEQAIRNTSTWYYTPTVYRRVKAQIAALERDALEQD